MIEVRVKDPAGTTFASNDWDAVNGEYVLRQAVIAARGQGGRLLDRRPVVRVPFENVQYTLEYGS